MHLCWCTGDFPHHNEDLNDWFAQTRSSEVLNHGRFYWISSSWMNTTFEECDFSTYEGHCQRWRQTTNTFLCDELHSLFKQITCQIATEVWVSNSSQGPASLLKLSEHVPHCLDSKHSKPWQGKVRKTFISATLGKYRTQCFYFVFSLLFSGAVSEYVCVCVSNGHQ